MPGFLPSDPQTGSGGPSKEKGGEDRGGLEIAALLAHAREERGRKGGRRVSWNMLPDMLYESQTKLFFMNVLGLNVPRLQE